MCAALSRFPNKKSPFAAFNQRKGLVIWREGVIHKMVANPHE